MQFLFEKDGTLVFRRRRELLEICAWGEGLRVRATQNRAFSGRDWALDTPLSRPAKVTIGEHFATIENGSIVAEITEYGKLTFYNTDGKLLLKEYYRTWEYGTEGWRELDQISQLRAAGREYRSVGGDNYSLRVRFEPNDEKFFGMGQYQQPTFDLKGSTLELEQKNTQVSVPFLLSSNGYGLLWNNPAVGRATLGTNYTEFTARSSKQIDYWIVAGNSPSNILTSYMQVVGKPPMMPEYALGFWQCKLRYQTQDELLSVAREYHRRNIPVGVIVVDFFHWTQQGDWQFDTRYWPNPKAMAEELDSLGMKLMVSVWPTVDRNSKNYREMEERDLLVRVDRGLAVTMDCWGFEQFFDATNPESREFVWNCCKENYRKNGVTLFWLDEAEPEYTAADWELYRYYDGPALECANEYPVQYARAFYEGMQKEGDENIINLIRCAWAGSAKYGALVWSGDVPSTFKALRNQYNAGLHMAMAGIPWWTADIGGFHGGNIHDPAFHELLARWFEFAAYLPVMRLHGDRDPHDKPPLGRDGGGMCFTGAENEVWAYPPFLQELMEKYIRRREEMRDYLREVMKAAHEEGAPVIRPLFYSFPFDKNCWEEKEEFMLGEKLLVCPVLEANVREREVYFPAGADWLDEDGREYAGGTSAVVPAPIDRIPVFTRK